MYHFLQAKANIVKNYGIDDPDVEDDVSYILYILASRRMFEEGFKIFGCRSKQWRVDQVFLLIALDFFTLPS